MESSRWVSRVRWAECDAAGIIYHARVFDWFSEGRLSWLQDHNLNYYDVLRPDGIELLVKTSTASFHHALRPGDPIVLTITLQAITPTRATFQYRIGAPANPAVEALTGVTEHAFVVNGRATRIDRFRPAVYKLFCDGRDTEFLSGAHYD